ncbi:hypothetical protein Syun_027373 [Stephania yunnanensis]|uniref:Uncharacterized protein n=1 Tax=Stephania yunnanensis TaxID=152371 RepID=A0AAP0EKK2_9MAGN
MCTYTSIWIFGVESIFDRNLDSFFYKNSSTNILLFNSLVPQNNLWLFSRFFSHSLLSARFLSVLLSVLLSARKEGFFSARNKSVLLAKNGSSLSQRKESVLLSAAKNRFFSPPQRIGSLSQRKESVLLSAAKNRFSSPQRIVSPLRKESVGSSLRKESVLLSAAIFGYSLRSNLWKKRNHIAEVCLAYYDELCVIFGDDQATGGNAITGNEANIELPSLEEMCNAEKSLPTKEEKDEVNQSSSSATRTDQMVERTKRKKCSNIDATEQGLTTAANRLADAFAHTDCARLQKELHNIPELSREDVMRAMLLLGGEVKDANIFFHLDEDLKKDWVLLYLQRKF